MNDIVVWQCPICLRTSVNYLSNGYVSDITCWHNGVIWQMKPLNPEPAQSMKMWENECGWVDGIGMWHSKEDGDDKLDNDLSRSV